ncbi:heterokaryon incompatibility protein-domain-containing protein [Aspergillus caelatus]|uniref:Heterokaryon incompatibility protein-domain-containing protein n=1 Tax=Aspergillus caelatus TaxID=61420 RepID=A0A5N7ABB1_9EURO|nr:heterokaryon incompatibility protein-domain-containing protein [Aspergillus caelatus]KAE8366618.1 heterokaryon incompatibility protein-domain-containing protein [Aspergillus caelatus]
MFVFARQNAKPLSYAAEEGHEAVVKLLLEKGAEADLRDKLETKPLLSRFAQWDYAERNLLLDAFAKRTSDNILGRTPLSYAAERGYEGVLRLLMTHGADPDTTDIFGQTPLSALSYTWGVSYQKDWILLNGSLFPVTQNLHDAIQQLQNQGECPSLLWIDLICINQNDISERCQQVSMMKDIFGMTNEVIVWLGKDTEINSSSSASAPYWSRVWVIHEIMVAKWILLMSGSGTAAWPEFVECLEGILRSLERDNIDFNREGQAFLNSNCRKLIELWKKKSMQNLSGR